MYKNKKILATVCARGGSKGVKLKNIRELDGKSLICYTLDLIKQSKYIDDYVISTDSEKIIETVVQYGFRVDFKRPHELAGDKVSRVEAIRHAVNWKIKNTGNKFDVIVDLGVATPLKSVDDVDGCIETLLESDATNVFSVNPSGRNPYYNMVELVDGKPRKVGKIKERLIDRKDAPKVYDMNDGINVWHYDVLFSDRRIVNEDAKFYIMDRERGIDIDEEIDFFIAESIVKYLKSRKQNVKE